MRVSELAKEIGKTSKEVLDILQKENQNVKTHSSNVSEEQIKMVKQNQAAPAAKHEDAAANGEAPKKKVAAVFRPQNSQQRPAQQRPQNQARPQQGAQNHSAAQSAPANGQSAPANSQSAPANTQSAPANTQSAPANTQAAPAQHPHPP